jgi:DNA-binding beta-propeller fold protein YncE
VDTDARIRPHFLWAPAGGRHLRWYIGAGAVALLALTGVALALALHFHVGQGSSNAARSLRAVPRATIHIRSGAVDVAVGAHAVWVSGFGRIARLDPGTNRVTQTVKTPGTEDYSQLAIGPGAVWLTADGGRLYRIDPGTDRVVTAVPVGGAIQGVVVGGGSVWVTRPADGAGEVVRVDPATNRVTGPPVKVGPGPVAAVYAFGALWVTNTSPPSVVRVDPTTGKVTTANFTGDTAAGFGSLWAASRGAVVRADPLTGRATATIPVPRPQAVAVGAGRVWVLGSPGVSSLVRPLKRTAELWQIDPARNRVSGRPTRLRAQQPIALAVGDGAVWVADYASGTVTRLDLVNDSRR